MCRFHADGVSTFIQSIFDFTSDLYGIPRPIGFTLDKMEFTLNNIEFTLDNMEITLDNGQYDTCFASLTI